MSIVIGVFVLLLGVLAVVDAVWRLLRRRRFHVLSWWSPAQRQARRKKTLQTITNPWAIPLKYRVGPVIKDGTEVASAYVPWSDIDPSFQPNAFHCGVSFEFSKTSSATPKSFRWKRRKGHASSLDAQGVFVLDESLALFKAFDGREVHILGPLSDTLVIHRPLGPKSMMRWSIRIPAFVSKEAANHYLVQNIHEIDRKLVQFIGDWH